MAFIKGIDVSSYQNNINWKAVKADGVSFAILKIMRKDLTPDKGFETNWKGCVDAGVTIQGVYNYSYATTVEKARMDANKVISILNGRKTCVWLDVEDNCQKNMGELLINIIREYAAVITRSGNRFGVYTGQSFYNSFIKKWSDKLADIPFWIARYGKNDSIPFSVVPNRNKPVISNVLLGWQYGSTVLVNGINGGVDANIWYYDLDDVNYIKPNNAVVQETTVDNAMIIEAKKNLNVILKDNNINGVAVNGVINDDFKVKINKALQTCLNKDFGTKLDIDGKIGPLTRTTMAKVNLTKGSTAYVASIVEILLMKHGINPNGFEYPGKVGSGLLKGVSKFYNRNITNIRFAELSKLL